MKPIFTVIKIRLIYPVMALITFTISHVSAQSKADPSNPAPTASCSATAVATPSSVCTGSTSVISLTSVTFGVNTYQWSSNINGAGWNVIAGATSSTYTTPALTSGNTYQYRCAVSDAGNFWCSSTPANSSSVSITPSSAASASAAGSDQNICVTTATLAGNTPVTGTGAWSLVSGSGTITSSTSPTSGLTALGPGANTFRWSITNGACVNTDDVIITNNDASSVAAYASSYCPASTTSAVLSLLPTYSTYTSIKWQQSDNGGAYTDIAGATTTPYTATKVAGHTYTYKAVITTACGTYTTAASTNTTTPYGFFDYSGGNNNYATANGNSDCFNNLVANQKYCFSFVYSRYIEMDWEPNGCAACPNIYMLLQSGMTVTSVSTNGCTAVSATIVGDCASASATCPECGPVMYDNTCGVVKSDGFQFGQGCSSPSMTDGNVYYVCFTVPATCGGMSLCPQINCSAGNCSSSPLPIELLYFNAEAVNGQVQLQWATATEINNDYFTVERSMDGRNFMFLGKVDGAGNSSAILNYNTVDEYPLKGTTYYRLKQTDFDGKFAFSKMASVKIASDHPLKLMYVSPDQNTTDLRYQFSYTESKPLMVEVLDVLGKTIYSQKVSSDENGQVLHLDAAGLSKGVYLMKISDGIFSEVKKFVY